MDNGKHTVLTINQNWHVTFEHPETKKLHTIAMGVPGNFALDLAAAGIIRKDEIMPADSSEKIRLFEKVSKTKMDKPQGF